MPRDRIDEEKTAQDNGYYRALTQEQHRELNRRYPGCSIKHCPICDEEIDDAKSFAVKNAGPHC